MALDNDGATLAVSAPANTAGVGANTGIIYIYEFDEDGNIIIERRDRYY